MPYDNRFDTTTATLRRVMVMIKYLNRGNFVRVYKHSSQLLHCIVQLLLSYMCQSAVTRSNKLNIAVNHELVGVQRSAIVRCADFLLIVPSVSIFCNYSFKWARLVWKFSYRYEILAPYPLSRTLGNLTEVWVIYCMVNFTDSTSPIGCFSSWQWQLTDIWTTTHHRTCRTILCLGRRCWLSAASAFRQLSTTYSNSLRQSGLFSCRPHNLELSPGFHPGLDHQCALFQMFAQDVFVRSILVYSAR